jgi:rhamnopyranosyl-N-acetylglucosaminyl-diphospho-decaprenol beta-1,3/1,4-galactofuranosyltransferase
VNCSTGNNEPISLCPTGNQRKIVLYLKEIIYNMKIVALVITYNRLDLLKENLKATSTQTRMPDEIVVIDNGCTDGTTEWLEQQPYTTFRFEENQGCSAGFAFGIKKAYELGADWIWLMDDDTIPQSETLERLEATLDRLGPHQQQVGYLSSKVLWTDGSIHSMNRCILHPENKGKSLFPALSDMGHSLIEYGTFLSMLLSAKAVEKVGLPFKDFFIWHDDIEYCHRINKAGLAGIYVPESTVVHATPRNYRNNVFKEPYGNAWKYKYGLRNQLVTKRLYKGEWEFWTLLLKRLVVWPFYILQKRQSDRLPFIKIVWASSLNAIRFQPAIEWVSRDVSHCVSEHAPMEGRPALQL